MFRLAVLFILTVFTTTPAQQPDKHPLQTAEELYNARRYDDAHTVLQRVIEGEPTNAEAFWLLGLVSQQLDDPEAAISAYKTAIFWEPNRIDTHISLARILLARNQHSEAKKYIKLALAIDPANQEVQTLRRLSR